MDFPQRLQYDKCSLIEPSVTDGIYCQKFRRFGVGLFPTITDPGHPGRNRCGRQTLGLGAGGKAPKLLWRGNDRVFARLTAGNAPKTVALGHPCGMNNAGVLLRATRRWRRRSDLCKAASEVSFADQYAPRPHSTLLSAQAALEFPPMDTPIKFCSNCGAAVAQRIPPDDNRLRAVCEACGTIHYQNPKLVVGSLPVWQDQVLLCRRAIEPRSGYWTLPAGFMENGETLPEAAIRETLEEACARIELETFYTAISVPHISQVHVIYRARLLDLDFAAGSETLETRLFHEHEIPWNEIAFRTIALSLRHYFADRQTGIYPCHTAELPPP